MHALALGVEVSRQGDQWIGAPGAEGALDWLERDQSILAKDGVVMLTERGLAMLEEATCEALRLAFDDIGL
jgi:hypothetical protein